MVLLSPLALATQLLLKAKNRLLCLLNSVLWKGRTHYYVVLICTKFGYLQIEYNGCQFRTGSCPCCHWEHTSAGQPQLSIERMPVCSLSFYLCFYLSPSSSFLHQQGSFSLAVLSFHSKSSCSIDTRGYRPGEMPLPVVVAQWQTCLLSAAIRLSFSQRQIMHGVRLKNMVEARFIENRSIRGGYHFYTDITLSVSLCL